MCYVSVVCIGEREMHEEVEQINVKIRFFFLFLSLIIQHTFFTLVCITILFLYPNFLFSVCQIMKMKVFTA